MTTVVTRLSRRVVRLVTPNPGPFTLAGTNCYLIGEGPEKLLVDTGPAKCSESMNFALSEYLAQTKASVSQIIMTHAHEDHCGAFPYLSSQLWLRPTALGWCPGSMRAPIPKLQEIWPTQIFQTKDATLRVISTPGHTQHHMAFHLKEENVIFTGDAILGGSSVIFDDLESFFDSLDRLKEVGAIALYPGHGDVISNPNAALETLIQRRLDRLKQISNALQTSETGLTARELVPIIYQKPYDGRSAQGSAEEAAIIHSLAYMELRGAVTRNGKRDDPSDTKLLARDVLTFVLQSHQAKLANSTFSPVAALFSSIHPSARAAYKLRDIIWKGVHTC